MPTTARTISRRAPFRAVDVLSGGIDKLEGNGRHEAPPERTRKQISAQLEPAQVRLLGELHARLNATARSRIEKSDLVGLGIELLAAVLDSAGREPAPEPDGTSRQTADGRRRDGRRCRRDPGCRRAADVRAYVATQVRLVSRVRGVVYASAGVHSRPEEERDLETHTLRGRANRTPIRTFRGHEKDQRANAGLSHLERCRF